MASKASKQVSKGEGPGSSSLPFQGKRDEMGDGTPVGLGLTVSPPVAGRVWILSIA